MQEEIEKISDTIDAVVTRMKDEHGLEPRIGFEWEFQLLGKGSAGPAELTGAQLAQLREFLEADPKIRDEIHKLNKEDEFGVYEVVTEPEEPVAAAATLCAIQKRISEWAKKNGCHFDSSPIVYDLRPRQEYPREHDITYPLSVHVNSSLVPADSGDAAQSVLTMDNHRNNMDPRTAHVALGILEAIEKTPLWSWHDHGDIQRLNKLQLADYLDISYKAGIRDKTKAGPSNRAMVSVRANIPADALHRVPEGGRIPVRVEERLGGSRVDPYVVAFRTVLGQYSGLERYESQGHTFCDDASVDRDHGKLKLVPDAIPDSWSGMREAQQLTGLYAGASGKDRLYTEETLAAINTMGYRPYIIREALENNLFGHPFAPDFLAARVAALIKDERSLPDAEEADIAARLRSVLTVYRNGQKNDPFAGTVEAIESVDEKTGLSKAGEAVARNLFRELQSRRVISTPDADEVKPVIDWERMHNPLIMNGIVSGALQNGQSRP